ncbi:MAG: hypothetical protein EB084_22225 [Proteobacteria bacterium]|nr:hypothetical protein [Pseudomonadota bacterium]
MECVRMHPPSHRTVRLSALPLALVVWLSLLASAWADPPATWAYVTALRSGAVYVVDVASARLVRVLRVEDARAPIGLCPSPDGNRLYVVDGDRRSRLRVIDTATGRVRAELSVASRRGAVDGAPVARVSADGAWLFIDTVEGVWVFDVREAPVRTRVGSRLRDVRFAGGRGRALLGVSRQSALAFSLPDIRGGGVSSRAPVGFSDVIDTIALSSGTRLFSLAAVPPMRRLPALRPTASPTPNPALKEGAWRLSAWGPGQATPTVIDLVKRVDLEKCDGASRPRIAVSPDDRWLAIVHGRRAWVLRTDELTVQHEIFPPGLASGAAFSADGSQLLTVLDERLLCWRLANRSQRFLLDGQMRLPGPAQIATAPRPSFAVSGER